MVPWKRYPLLAICEANPIMISGFPHKKTVALGSDVFCEEQVVEQTVELYVIDSMI